MSFLDYPPIRNADYPVCVGSDPVIVSDYDNSLAEFALRLRVRLFDDRYM